MMKYLYVYIIVLFCGMSVRVLSQTEDVSVRFHFTDDQIAMVMDAKVSVKGIQVEFNNIASFPADLSIDTPLGVANYEYRDQKKQLAFLIYDPNANLILPGNNIKVFVVNTTIQDVDQITIKELIVADKENKAIQDVQKSILYEPVSNTKLNNTVQSFILNESYPNPFNAETVIPVKVERQLDIDISIYDVQGRHIKTLASGIVEPGTKSYTWNATDEDGKALSAGVYMHVVRTKEKIMHGKMFLIR